MIVTSTAGVTAYSLDGKPQWNYEWTFTGMALRTVGSAIAAEGLIFACAGDGSGEHGMIAVRPGEPTAKASLVWKKTSGTPYVPTLLAHDGYLYGIHDDGMAMGIEAKTGKMQWRTRLCGKITASPVMIDGKVYAIDEKGMTYVFASDPANSAFWARARSESPSSPPRRLPTIDSTFAASNI